MPIPRRTPKTPPAIHDTVADPETPDGAVLPEVHDAYRTVGGAMFVPAGTPRRARRAAAAAARKVGIDHRRAVAARRRAEAAAVAAETKAAGYLPARGETGPAALRSIRPLRLRPHRATSEVLAGAYPFLAEAGLGSEGVLVGHDSWSGAAFCFDPWVLYEHGVLTNPNVLLAGIIGRGKSSLAKSLATRSVAFGRKVYVPGDPKGEWTVVSKAVGGTAIELGGGLPGRLNPLDESPRPANMTDRQWAHETRTRRRSLLGALAETALGRPLQAVEHTAVDAALDVAVRDNTTPVLPHVVAALFNPPAGVAGSSVAQLAADSRQVGHALARTVTGDLGGLFDGPSTIRFEPNLPMISLDLSRISGSDHLIGMVMTCASSWMEAALTNPQAGQRWVIYDEAWRLLAQPALLARMQSQWKLSRALGIANLMIIHRLSDLDAVGDADSETRNLALGLLADCSTKIIYAQESGEATKTGNTLGLSTTETAQLPNLTRGEGLWRLGERAFLITHTMTPDELTCFNTNQRMTGNAGRFPGFPTDQTGTEG
ncbi:MAG: ATP-binding protein [Acidimicrobiales bacterium]